MQTAEKRLDQFPSDSRLKLWNKTVPWTTSLLPNGADGFELQTSTYEMKQLEFRHTAMSATAALQSSPSSAARSERFLLMKSPEGRRKYVFGDRVLHVGEGDLVFLKPSAFRLVVSERKRSITVSGPLGALNYDPQDHPDIIHLKASDPRNRAISGAIDSIAKALPSAGQTELAGYEAALVGLLNGLVLAPAAHSADVTRGAEERRRRVMSFVEENLGDPDLSPTLVADRLGVGRATLARYFEVDGGLSSYIRARRLELAMTLITNGSPHRGKITRAAKRVGHFDGSHFNRLFRSHFWLSPTEAMRLSDGLAA